MTGKARERRTSSGIIGKSKNDINKLFNIRTRNKIVTPTQITLPSGVTNSGIGGNYLPLSGGVMNGPIGGKAFVRTIVTGNLDLTTDNASNGVSEFPIIFISPESGTTDTLDTIKISNSFPVGGRILLVGVSGNTIGISVSGTTSGLTKAIMVDGGSDQELGSTEVMELFYDIVSDKFHIIGTFSQTQIIDGDTSISCIDSLPEIRLRLNGVLNITWEHDGSGNEVQTMTDCYLDMNGKNILNADIIFPNAGVLRTADETVFHAFTGFMGFSVSSVAPTTTAASNVGALKIPYIASTDNTPSATTLNDWFGDIDGCIGLQFDDDAPDVFKLWAKLNSTWHYVLLT